MAHHLLLCECPIVHVAFQLNQNLNFLFRTIVSCPRNMFHNSF